MIPRTRKIKRKYKEGLIHTEVLGQEYRRNNFIFSSGFVEVENDSSVVKLNA